MEAIYFLARKIFEVVFAAIIFLNFATAHAEDLKFIDATGDTGYYIDMDSVKILNGSNFSVDFIVIRADKNEITIADLTINHAEKNYFVKSTRTLSYDERTEIHSDDTRHTKKSYSEKSLMYAIVQIILNANK